MPAKSSSISDMCSEFGVTPRTLRFYELTGLVQPARDGTRRVYCKADRARPKLILRGKRFGFSLDAIADMERPLKWGEKLLAPLKPKASNR